MTKTHIIKRDDTRPTFAKTLGVNLDSADEVRFYVQEDETDGGGNNDP